MMGDWEKVRYKIDVSLYKGTKIGYKTRQIYGSALDDFNTGLDDLDAKKAELERVKNLIEDDEGRERIGSTMTSAVTLYEKLRNTVLYERSLLPPTVNAVFDSFAADEMEISSPLDGNSESFRNALALVEQLRSAKN